MFLRKKSELKHGKCADYIVKSIEKVCVWLIFAENCSYEVL